MAQSMMAAIPALKDTYIQLKTRMDKAVDDFRKAMVATRNWCRRWLLLTANGHCGHSSEIQA